MGGMNMNMNMGMDGQWHYMWIPIHRSKAENVVSVVHIEVHIPQHPLRCHWRSDLSSSDSLDLDKAVSETSVTAQSDQIN